jgi:hypothetical protein
MWEIFDELVGLFVEDFPAASVVDQAVNVWKFL